MSEDIKPTEDSKDEHMDQTDENMASKATDENASADTAADAAEAVAETPAETPELPFSFVFDDVDEEDGDDATDAAEQSDAADAASAAIDVSTAAEAAAAAETDSASATSADTGTTDTNGTDSANSDATSVADPSADVTAANARRVNETLRLAEANDKQSGNMPEADLAHDQAEAKPAMTLASRIDRNLGAGREDDILLKAYPAFSLNKVTVTLPKSGRSVLDGVSMEFHSGHTYAVTVDADDAEARRTLLGTLTGFIRPDSGAVMNKSANIAELEPVELRGHRLGIIPRRNAVREDLDAEANVLNAMEASNRTFLKPKPVIARELLERTGLTTASKGVKLADMPVIERKRVAIARAIACEAEVIIADEPLAGLANDDERADILTLLTMLARKGDPKHCVIIVTSDAELTEATDRTYEI